MTLEELRNVLRDCDVAVGGVELRALFGACDRDGEGTVDWADWLGLIRPPLSKRRLNGVRAAWYRVCGDATRAQARDVADRYDAASHPEVVSGRESKDAVFRLFLDAFDVGAEAPGIATVAEFEAYHTNLGATIASDDYFDQVLKVWQATPSEEPSVPVVETAKRAPTPLSVAAALRARGDRVREPAIIPTPAGGSSAATCTVKDALSRGIPRTRRGDGKLVKRSADLRDVVGVERLVLDVRRQLARHGPRGIIGLGRKLAAVDALGSGLVTMSQFKTAVRDVGFLDLTDAEVRLLFESQADTVGTVDIKEFLRVVRGDMSSKRKALVRKAFDVIDASRSGAVEPSDIAQRYDAGHHPDVVAGIRSADDVHAEFLETFDVGGDMDGKVTAREFEAYYANVSSTIDDDAHFELVVRNAWHVPGGDKRVLVSHADGSQSVARVRDDTGLELPRDADEVLRQLKAQGLDDAVAVTSAASSRQFDAPRTFREVSRTRAAGGGPKRGGPRSYGGKRVAPGGVFASQISLAHDSTVEPRGVAAPQTSPTNSVFHSALGPDMRERQPFCSTVSAAGRPAAEIMTSSDATLAVGSLGVALKRRDAQGVLARVRSRLRDLGARSVAGIARKFRIADIDRSKTVSAAEFAKIMNEASLDLDPTQVSALFAKFDREFGRLLVVLMLPVQATAAAPSTTKSSCARHAGP